MPEHDIIPDDLEKWLHIATDELCDESRSRARAEITALFTTTVKAELEKGLSLERAQDTGFAALGNPDRANAQLLQTSLTVREAGIVRFQVKAIRSPLRWWELILISLLGDAVFLLCRIKSPNWTWILMGIAAFNLAFGLDVIL